MYDVAVCVFNGGLCLDTGAKVSCQPEAMSHTLPCFKIHSKMDTNDGEQEIGTLPKPSQSPLLMVQVKDGQKIDLRAVFPRHSVDQS